MAEKREMSQKSRKRGVAIPKLSDAVVRSRAEWAYARATELAIISRFDSAPGRSEMKGLAALLKAQVRRNPGKALDVDKAVMQFVRKKPRSRIARYYKATGTTDWLDATYKWWGRKTSSGVKVTKIKLRFRFDKAKLQNQVRGLMIGGKKQFGNQAVKLNNPKVRKAIVSMASVQKMLSNTVSRMAAHLEKLLKDKRKGLSHFKLAYRAPNLLLTSNLKLSRKRFGF